MTAAFTVLGIAQPQGSKSARVIKGKDGAVDRAVMTEGFGDGPRNRAEWRAIVSACARLWSKQHGLPAPMDGPLELSIVFYLPRPKSLPRRVEYPIGKPDLSKLTRAVEDSLRGIVIADDARIVTETTRKRFAVASPARAEIVVEQLAARAIPRDIKQEALAL